MEENTNLNVILKEKFDSYSNNFNNYVAPSELTVTITLNEYRELVGQVATKNEFIDKAKSAQYEAERKVATLKEENAKLKAELYEVTKGKGEE